jgi:hypothetical protein
MQFKTEADWRAWFAQQMAHRTPMSQVPMRRAAPTLERKRIPGRALRHTPPRPIRVKP